MLSSVRRFALTLPWLLLQHTPSLLSITASTKVCNPHDFGARGDGITLDTQGIVKAMQACSSGGHITFEGGKTYRLGSITVSGTGIHLVLPKGAQLLASAERADYGPNQDGWYLLHFHRCTGCSLSGGGLVEGCAKAFQTRRPPNDLHVSNWRDPSCAARKQCRPRLVGVVGCSGVILSDVALRDSAFWTLHVKHSEHVELRDLNVTGDMDFPNNDGIDIDGSSHVTVRGCRVATADDAICMKTTSGGADRPTRHVAVTNCTLTSRSAAVKLGSESRANMYNITFSHLKVLDSNRGLAIQLRDHGDVYNITFEHIHVSTGRVAGGWWGAGEPLYVTALPRWLGSAVGRLRNITFRHITAETRGGLAVLVGSPESTMHGISLKNVTIRLAPPPHSVLPLRLAPSAAAAAAADDVDAYDGDSITTGGGGVAELGRPMTQSTLPVATDGRDGARQSAVPAPVSRTRARTHHTGVAFHRAAAAQLRRTAQQRPAWARLDLRPGPYGVRPLAPDGPLVAQFLQDLALRDVDFQVLIAPHEVAAEGQEAARLDGKVEDLEVEVQRREQQPGDPSGDGGMAGGDAVKEPKAAAAGGMAAVLSKSGSGERSAVPTWFDPEELQQRMAGDQQRHGGKVPWLPPLPPGWCFELTKHTVEVATAYGVEVQVVRVPAEAAAPGPQPAPSQAGEGSSPKAGSWLNNTGRGIGMWAATAGRQGDGGGWGWHGFATRRAAVLGAVVLAAVCVWACLLRVHARFRSSGKRA